MLTLSLSTAAALKWSHRQDNTHTHTQMSLAASVQLFVCTHTFYVGVELLFFFLAVIYQSRALATFSSLQGHGRHLQYVTRMTLLPAQLVHMLTGCKCVLTQIHMEGCCKNNSNTVYSNSKVVQKLMRAKFIQKCKTELEGKKIKYECKIALVHITHTENGTSLYPQCVNLIHKRKVGRQWCSQ